jgi:hypothetical protein
MRTTGWQEADRLAGGRQAGRGRYGSRQTGCRSWQEVNRLAGGRQADRRQTQQEAD